MGRHNYNAQHIRPANSKLKTGCTSQSDDAAASSVHPLCKNTEHRYSQRWKLDITNQPMDLHIIMLCRYMNQPNDIQFCLAITQLTNRADHSQCTVSENWCQSLPDKSVMFVLQGSFRSRSCHQKCEISVTKRSIQVCQSFLYALPPVLPNQSRPPH